MLMRRIAAGLLMFALLMGAGSVAPDRSNAAPTPPSVVVIVTDDQRFDTLMQMPNVQSLLVAHGVTFANAFVSEPECCPSRASILTGRYAHSTGVYRNDPPYGGFPSFDDSSTLATWLDPGYTTGLFGKYLNDYKVAGTGGYIPPGWDRWSAFLKPNYYDYDLNTDGDVVHHSSQTLDYSTTELGSQAASFVRNSSGPVFLYYAPYGPHGPALAAPGDEDLFTHLDPWRPPSFDEQHIADKPRFIRDIPPLTHQRIDAMDRLRMHQLQSLQSVDREVGEIVSALEDTGRLSHTMIVFTSDNGLSWGEHRWAGKKRVPYEESIRVPMVIRYDPLTAAPATDTNVVANIDIAPTIAELTGVTANSPDGSSLMPLLAGSAAPWRQALLLEYLHKNGNAGGVPTYCGVRTASAMYTRYKKNGEELYDLSKDPYEMSNVASDKAYATLLSDMQARLATLCNPPPPGYP